MSGSKAEIKRKEKFNDLMIKIFIFNFNFLNFIFKS